MYIARMMRVSNIHLHNSKRDFKKTNNHIVDNLLYMISTHTLMHKLTCSQLGAPTAVDTYSFLHLRTR